MFKKGTAQRFPTFDFQQHQRPSDVTGVQIIYPNLHFKYLNTFSLGHLEIRQASSWPWPAYSLLKSRNLLLFLRGISSSFSYNLKILISRSIFNSQKSTFSLLALCTNWTPLRQWWKWNVTMPTGFNVLFVPWVIPGCGQSSCPRLSLGSPLLLPHGRGHYHYHTTTICNSVSAAAALLL